MKTDFKINISEEIINDLNNRLAATKWPDEIDNKDWKYGTNETYLKELCAYWQTGFDWKKQEDYLNTFHHYKANIHGINLHFIHEKGQGDRSIPLLLTHGWPDSFVRFLKLIPLLIKADENGFSFDVIVPSIPGFGFSDKPTQPGMNPEVIADLFTHLMTDELGYEKFLAQGGDWGSSITEQISKNHSDVLMGIHLTDIPFSHLFSVPAGELTEPEKKYLEKGKQWQQTEGAYAMIQSTKPQTLSYGLIDSPAGLAAWIIEKFYRWSDCNNKIETCFSKDELLTNLTIYWATETINSACRIYYEAMQSMQQAKNKPTKKIEVPTGVAIFPKDIIPAPREYADRIFNIQQWTEMSKGGHFASMEQPELLANDIRKFAIGLNK